MKEINRLVFEAIDGKQFSDKTSAEDHEISLFVRSLSETMHDEIKRALGIPVYKALPRSKTIVKTKVPQRPKNEIADERNATRRITGGECMSGVIRFVVRACLVIGDERMLKAFELIRKRKEELLLKKNAAALMRKYTDGDNDNNDDDDDDDF